MRIEGPHINNQSHDNRSTIVSSTITFIILSGVRLCPLGTGATTGLLYQPQVIDDGDCGVISGTKIGPAPLSPPQIPHDQTRAEPGSTLWEARD
jgi:hypothetical protein